MPSIPGTDLKYYSNAFLVGSPAIFDIPSVAMESGLVSIREWLQSSDIHDVKTIGEKEMISLQALFVASKLDAIEIIIATAALDVKGHRETKWDFTDVTDAIWIVEEPQLSDLIWMNPEMQDWTDITFVVGSSAQKE